MNADTSKKVKYLTLLPWNDMRKLKCADFQLLGVVSLSWVEVSEGGLCLCSHPGKNRNDPIGCQSSILLIFIDLYWGVRGFREFIECRCLGLSSRNGHQSFSASAVGAQLCSLSEVYLYNSVKLCAFHAVSHRRPVYNSDCDKKR